MKKTWKEWLKKIKDFLRWLWESFQKNAGPIGTVVAIFALLLTWDNYHASKSAALE